MSSVKYLNQEEAKNIDLELFNEFSFSVDQLMELAGLSCATAIHQAYPLDNFSRHNGSILICCGPGNNGGDGLVCARHLKLFGYKPVIFYPKKSSGKLFENLVIQCNKMEIPFTENSESFILSIDNSFDAIVDALFGFSFKPPVRLEFEPIINKLSNTNLPIISIDIPSGWNVEDGPVENEHIKPETIISLTAPKLCVKYFKGKNHFLGGRFVPNKLALKYNLNLPEYTYDLSKLSDIERRKLEHMKLHEEHRGHETMHLEMFLILVVCLIITQFLLIQWRQRHLKSFQQATLIGMWLVPMIISFYNSWFRFIFIWTVFSIVTAIMAFAATRKPMAMTTPSRVYTWFLLIYKLSYFFGIVGYLVIMSTLFGLNILFMIKPGIAMDFGFLITFYGLYFGVVGRDLSAVCSDKMAAQIGYYTQSGVPTRTLDEHVCAVCGNKLDSEEKEKFYKLNCGHTFHDFCIRGWCIIGKKQTCPYCRERVDLQRMFKNPWEKPHLLYGSLLDWVRYLVAWQPLIFVIIHGVFWTFGLK